MSYNEVCPECGNKIVNVTRGIPSMGTCENGHINDRKYTMSPELFALVGKVKIPVPQKSITLSEKDWEDIFHIMGSHIVGPEDGPRGAATRLYYEIRNQIPHMKHTLSKIATKPPYAAIFIERKDFS